jgi:maltooligosyltrehalose trehalohydrolase
MARHTQKGEPSSMAKSNLLPMNSLGAVENAGAVTFGLLLPWVSAADGNKISVKVIHEDDQYMQGIPPQEFQLNHGALGSHGDYWSATVQIAGATAPSGSSWGKPGRYVYRYVINNPNVGVLDWIIDPFAREFGVGKLSAFTLGYTPYSWSAAEAAWKAPPLRDLVMYEVNVAELGGDLARIQHLMDYLRDLGVNAIEVMPLSNVGVSVDWGYLPIGYFGVDERMGKRSDFQALVDIAHQNGIAVIVDVVYGHTGTDFPYYDAYTRLRYHQSPFMGSFAKDLFSNFGRSTDFRRQLTRDYFHSADQHWLHVYHVDGFRYDCVPNFWDGPVGDGYANHVYDTYQLTKGKVAAGDQYWTRFDGGPGAPLRLVQCAEQLEMPRDVLLESYSNCTWQNGTYDAARKVARGDRGQLYDLGMALGLHGYTRSVTAAGDVIPKSALQYTENHDHERFVCNFGTFNLDEAQNPLFAEGDRSRWYMTQPYLIALLMGDGIPMLWQGQEFAENYDLPGFGAGRVGLIRPLRWDYFYDEAGQGTVRLVRRLLQIRKARQHIRHGSYFFFNDWDRYQRHGLLLFARYTGASYTLVAVNTSGADQTVPFWLPIGGNYVEELHGGALDLSGVQPLQQVQLTVPAHYGRIWTHL